MDEKTLMQIRINRQVMKGHGEFSPETDQSLGVPQPALYVEREYLKVYELPTEYKDVITANNLFEVMNRRNSKRSFTDQCLALGELSWLLWITQGERVVIGKRNKASMRTVPSAGARQPLETYLLINKVEGLEQGLYHYIPSGHKLGYLGTKDNLTEEAAYAFGGQTFFAEAPVGFIWAAVPYRTEWRYALQAQKYALLDAGHVCENLYLAAGSIGCGTCAIGAYRQKEADALLGLDGSESDAQDQQFVIYAAALGKVE